MHGNVRPRLRHPRPTGAFQPRTYKLSSDRTSSFLCGLMKAGWCGPSPIESRSGAARHPSGEQAPAQERPFERVVAMHAAPAEARGLTGSEQSPRSPLGPPSSPSTNTALALTVTRRRYPQHSPLQIRVQPAQRLPREHPQSHGDEWSGLGIRQPMRRHRAHDLVTHVSASRVDGLDLSVLCERQGYRPGRRATAMSSAMSSASKHRTALDPASSKIRTGIPQPRSCAPRVPSTESACTKSSPCRRNASIGSGAPDPNRPASCRTDFPVRSGFCSDPDSANSFSMIRRLRMNHE